MKNLFAVFFALFLAWQVQAQGTGFAINHDGANPHPYALLELEWAAAPQGFLAPRMAEANIPASPVEGLIIYITDGDFPGFYQYRSSDWKPLRHNNFKGYYQTSSLVGSPPITGSSPGLEVQTDGSNLVFNYVNTGVVEVDLSAYSFTDPVVQATGKFIIADDPEPCNGVWGDGIVDQNHLHQLIVRPQSGSPIILYETNETIFTGPIINFAHGTDRASGYDYDTPLDDPPGRLTYYQNGLDSDLLPIAGWAAAAANSSNWPDNDQFPGTGSAAWTALGIPEVYNTTALTAGDNYIIEIQPNHEPIIELGQPFNSEIGIYVDFNKDGDFSDAGEIIYNFTQPVWSVAEQVNLPVPASAINGKARMRIVVQRAGNFNTASGQSNANPDIGESCLANFAGQYAGHTYEFDLVIDGGAPPYIYEGTFCNVSDVSNTTFTVRCYNQNGEPDDIDFDFNVYDKF